MCDDNGAWSFRLNGSMFVTFQQTIIGGNSYHFDIKNLFQDYMESLKIEKLASKVMIDVGIEEINVGDIYFFSDGFSLEEALVMSTNQKIKR